MTENRIKLLEAENARLRAENAKLRANAGQRAAFVHRINQAHDDALLLAQQAAAGNLARPTRRFAEEYFTMPRRRWQNAIALLRMARLFGNRHWLDVAGADVVARLDNARQRALEVPEAFYARLSSHGRDAWRFQRKRRRV